MKYPGLVLLWALAANLPAQTAAPADTTPTEQPKENSVPATSTPAEPVIITTTSESIAKPSARLLETLTASLPKYNPPPPPEPERPVDPDILVLEKKVVTQKRRPRLGDEDLMKNKAFNEMLAKKNLSSFDRNVLNKFTLPKWMGGQSAADRAREEYEYQQRQQLMEDVSTIAKAAEIVDPAQAKALRDAAAKK